MRCAALALAVVLPLAGCDALDGGSQQQFEDEAFLTPPGTADGWRTSPAVDARLRVTAPAPNPAGAFDEVALLVDASFGEPAGFELRRLLPNGIDQDLVAVAPGVDSPWFYTLAFLGRDVDPLGRPGTYRLLLYDGVGRLVAFGDFTLRN